MNPFPVRTALATVATAVIGVVALAHLTHGFTALTAETGRRAAIRASPVIVPQVLGVDQAGRVHDMLSDPVHAARLPRVTIVDFVYTRCETVCSALGSTYEQLQTEIRSRRLDGKVRLLTVSFDPANDTPAALAAYAVRMHVDPRIWTVMTPVRREQLPGLLTAFGVVVVPAPLNQFQHNAALHVVDRYGRLVRIFDLDDRQGVLDKAASLSRPEGLLL